MFTRERSTRISGEKFTVISKDKNTSHTKTRSTSTMTLSMCDRKEFMGKYTSFRFKTREKEWQMVTEFSQKYYLSKSTLLQKCMMYCYKEMIDVSNIKISTVQDYKKQKSSYKKEKKFNPSAYAVAYCRDNYIWCETRMFPFEAEILIEFAQNLNLTKSALLQKCMIYCYNEEIDVSDVKISSAQDYVEEDK